MQKSCETLEQPGIRQISIASFTLGSYFTSLSSGFSICKLQMIILISQKTWELKETQYVLVSQLFLINRQRYGQRTLEWHLCSEILRTDMRQPISLTLMKFPQAGPTEGGVMPKGGAASLKSPPTPGFHDIPSFSSVTAHSGSPLPLTYCSCLGLTIFLSVLFGEWLPLLKPLTIIFYGIFKYFPFFTRKALIKSMQVLYSLFCQI